MDSSYFSVVTEWFYQHSNWIGPAVGITAFLETLLIVGLIIPGVVMLMALCGIAGVIHTNIFLLIFWGFIGAVLGDAISFWIGHKFQHKIKKFKIFSEHSNWLARGEIFFEKYGPMSIALGRFIGPIRPFIPTVAGMLGMNSTQFYTINIISSVPWAFAYILPGYYAGALIEKLSKGIFTNPILTNFILILCCFLLAWLITECIFLYKKYFKTNYSRWSLCLLLTILAISIRYFYADNFHALEYKLLHILQYNLFSHYASIIYQFIIFLAEILTVFMAWELKKHKYNIAITYTILAITSILLLLQNSYLYPNIFLWELIEPSIEFSFIIHSFTACMLLTLVSIITDEKHLLNILTWKHKFFYVTVFSTILALSGLAAATGILTISNLFITVFLAMFYTQTLKFFIK